jgi:hypothetical protein
MSLPWEEWEAEYLVILVVAEKFIFSNYYKFINGDL